jgi:NADH-quinone oxidoreductase subunit C
VSDLPFDQIREHLAGVAQEATVAHGVLALLVEPGHLLDVVYHFYSTRDHVRVRVKTRVPAEDPVVDTLVPLYGSARYMERECHEMYGIVFRGNDDLRPLLLYEGFVGHPLRKDYPKRKEQPLVPYRK